MSRPRKPERSAHYESASYLAVLRALSTNLRRLRTERSWTQLQAAEHCGLALIHYARLETEATNFTALSLARLTDGFSVPVANLLQTETSLAPLRAATIPPSAARRIADKRPSEHEGYHPQPNAPAKPKRPAAAVRTAPKPPR